MTHCQSPFCELNLGSDEYLSIRITNGPALAQRRRPATRLGERAERSGGAAAARSIIRSLEPPAWGCTSGEQRTSTFSTNWHHHHHHHHRWGETLRSASAFQRSIDFCVRAKNLAMSAARRRPAIKTLERAYIAILFITTGPGPPAAADGRLDCMHCRPQTSTDDWRQ